MYQYFKTFRGGSMKISSENGPILQYTGYCSCLAVDLSAGDPCR